MLSYADNQSSVNAGAQQLLEDMQKGIGDVISKSSAQVLVWIFSFELVLMRGRWAGEARGLGGAA